MNEIYLFINLPCCGNRNFIVDTVKSRSCSVSSVHSNSHFYLRYFCSTPRPSTCQSSMLSFSGKFSDQNVKWFRVPTLLPLYSALHDHVNSCFCVYLCRSVWNPWYQRTSCELVGETVLWTTYLVCHGYLNVCCSGDGCKGLYTWSCRKPASDRWQTPKLRPRLSWRSRFPRPSTCSSSAEEKLNGMRCGRVDWFATRSYFTDRGSN